MNLGMPQSLATPVVSWLRCSMGKPDRGADGQRKLGNRYYRPIRGLPALHQEADDGSSIAAGPVPLIPPRCTSACDFRHGRDEDSAVEMKTAAPIVAKPP